MRQRVRDEGNREGAEMTEFLHARDALEAFIQEITPLIPFYQGAVVSVFGREDINGNVEVIKSIIHMDPLRAFEDRPAVKVDDYVCGAFKLDGRSMTF